MWRIFLGPRLSKLPRTSFLRQSESSGAYFSWLASLWRNPLEEGHALVGFALSGDETQGTSSSPEGQSQSFCFLVAMVNDSSWKICCAVLDKCRGWACEWASLLFWGMTGWQQLTFCESLTFGELRAWEDRPLIICPWFPCIPLFKWDIFLLSTMIQAHGQSTQGEFSNTKNSPLRLHRLRFLESLCGWFGENHTGVAGGVVFEAQMPYSFPSLWSHQRIPKQLFPYR